MVQHRTLTLSRQCRTHFRTLSHRKATEQMPPPAAQSCQRSACCKPCWKQCQTRPARCVFARQIVPHKILARTSAQLCLEAPVEESEGRAAGRERLISKRAGQVEPRQAGPSHKKWYGSSTPWTIAYSVCLLVMQ